MNGISYSLGIDASPGMAALNAMRGAVGAFSGAIGKVAGLAGLAGGLGLAGAAAVGFKRAISEAADMETMSTSFEVLLGSAARAREMLDQVRSFAAATPMEMPGIADAARTLLNFNVAAGDVLPTLRQLGDVAGGDSQRFASMALVFGQVASAGKLAGQDLLQFINAGFNPLLQISKTTGESMLSLRAKMEAGKIGIDDVRAALTAATGAGGQFEGMMEKQSQTWNGMMSTLKDGIGAVFRAFGEPILPQLKPILTEGIGLTERLAMKAREWGRAVADVIGFMRNAGSMGKLGEVAGLALKVGFASAIEFLAEGVGRVMDLFSKSFGKMEGMRAAFEGAAMYISAAISDGITNALQSVKIAGIPVLSKERADLQRSASDVQRKVGAGVFQSGLDQMMAGGGVTGQIAGFVKGLNTEAEDARAQLAGLWQDLSPKEVLGPSIDEWREYQRSLAASGPAAPPSASPAASRVTPLSDTLAKIGGFIGGAGGPRGEKAQQDTARNTAQIVRLQERTVGALERFGYATGGTF